MSPREPADWRVVALAWGWLVCAWLAGLAVSEVHAADFQFIGPSKCVGCHDHERQATKWQKQEPAQLKGKAHYNTLKQLDAAKSPAYAKAVGLADPYALKGSCVQCHATVFRGDANAGVSCESCHGAASGYLDIHQVKGSYVKSVAGGLRDLKDKVGSVVRTCVECHVVADKRLAAAGHPTGSGFDAGASLQKLVHWKTAYDFARVTAEGRAASARAGGAATASSAAAGGSRSAGAPSAPRQAPAEASASTARPDPAPAPPEPAPWDWDQPIPALPADYVPADLPPAVTSAPAAPKARPRGRADSPPPSIAEETALPFPASDAALDPLSPALESAEPPLAGPRPPVAEIVELRGRGAALLERLLRAGARAPALPAPAKPGEFQGPDSELLRLQEEVLALALEALRRPQ